MFHQQTINLLQIQTLKMLFFSLMLGDQTFLKIYTTESDFMNIYYVIN